MPQVGIYSLYREGNLVGYYPSTSTEVYRLFEIFKLLGYDSEIVFEPFEDSYKRISAIWSTRVFRSKEDSSLESDLLRYIEVPEGLSFCLEPTNGLYVYQIRKVTIDQGVPCWIKKVDILENNSYGVVAYDVFSYSIDYLSWLVHNDQSIILNNFIDHLERGAK